MVAVFLWTSYPDRVFVLRLGLEVPKELKKIIASRYYNLIASNAHLVPDEFVDKFSWECVAEDIARKVVQVVRMGIENISILPHTFPGGDIQKTIREFIKTVVPMVERNLK